MLVINPLSGEHVVLWRALAANGLLCPTEALYVGAILRVNSCFLKNFRPNLKVTAHAHIIKHRLPCVNRQ